MSTEKYTNEELIKEKRLEDNELAQIAGGVSIGAISGSNAYNNYRYNRQANQRQINEQAALSGLLNSNTNSWSYKFEKVKKSDSKNTNRVETTSNTRQNNSNNNSNNQSNGQRFSGWG